MASIDTVLPTQITIRPDVNPGSDSDWQNKPLVRRFMADRYSGQDMTASAGAPGIKDVLDIINPLQHIPFVSTLYQELTGDKPTGVANIAGGALFGGPIGLFASIVDTVFEQATGKSVAGTAIAAITGDTAKSTTQMASNDTGLTSDTKAAQEFAQADTGNQAVADAVAQDETAAQTQMAKQKMAAATYQSRAADMQLANMEILPPDTADLASGKGMSTAQASDVMSLYGGSQSPASRAYQKANMMGYLQSAPAANLVM